MEVWAEGEGKGGAQGYEAHEVTKKREKLLCHLLRRKKFFYLFDVITWGQKNKSTANNYLHRIAARKGNGDWVEKIKMRERETESEEFIDNQQVAGEQRRSTVSQSQLVVPHYHCASIIEYQKAPPH